MNYLKCYFLNNEYNWISGLTIRILIWPTNFHFCCKKTKHTEWNIWSFTSPSGNVFSRSSNSVNSSPSVLSLGERRNPSSTWKEGMRLSPSIVSPLLVKVLKSFPKIHHIMNCGYRNVKFCRSFWKTIWLITLLLIRQDQPYL